MGELVRDRIPEFIRMDGGEPHVRVLDDDADFLAALVDKLASETQEARGAHPAELQVELADVYAVVAAICDVLGCTMADLDRQASEKEDRRGGFGRRLYLET